jgi:hypothetical protein
MTIVPVDDVWLRLDCDEHIAREVSEHFSFDVPGAKFMPQFRNRSWTGKIRLFKLRGHLLYRGLLPRLLEFAMQQGYEVTNLVPVPDPLMPELSSWIDAQPLPVIPRDYQVAALRAMLDAHRGIILSPTGSGKSLIIYLLLQALATSTLVIVPTTGLVAQMKDDFTKYGADPTTLQTIQGGRTKERQSSIVISTWQSIYQQPPEYFKQFQCVIVDEVHLAKSKSLTNLMEKCHSTPYRFGFTGTLDDTQAHRLILEGLFGSVTRVISTHQLVKQQQLTPLKVKLCAIKYPVATCKDMRRALYQDEVEFLVTDPARLEIVARTAAATKGNTLVLFNYVEKHGKPLFQRIQDIVGDRDVHFVSGEVSAEEREQIRQWVEQSERQIIVASYGTFSTGINIPNLDTLIFASPSKSKIRVLQSVGRSLRLHKNKTHATLIDFIDDLRIGSSVNHTFRHAEQRVQYYAAERFPYTFHEFDLEKWVSILSTPIANDTETGLGRTNATSFKGR